MSDLVIKLDSLGENDRIKCGGKATSLAILNSSGFRIPEGSCVTTDAYWEFIGETGLKGRMVLELSRKDFDEMRWEEMWDLGLRMRTMFLDTPMPNDLSTSLLEGFQSIGEPVVIRSSSLAEDSETASFAGIHDSFVNIIGEESILDHVRMVWASLWSDRAILYRRELGLDIESSAMAVLIQAMIVGRKSGVVFSRDPENEEVTIIEAVPGLNQGMVDGTVPPDRWRIERATGTVIKYVPASRDKISLIEKQGVALFDLSGREESPLSDEEVHEIFRGAISIEGLFGKPQDIEFTFDDGDLYFLQSRPITTLEDDKERGWYRSLRRSFENLCSLRETIERDIMPKMAKETRELESVDLTGMEDGELADEIERRRGILDDWEDAYHEYLIPFAHGMRLFGEVYNKVVRPKDAHQFIELLATGDMLSTRRNKALMKVARMAVHDRDLLEKLKKGVVDDPKLNEQMGLIVGEMGGRLRGSSDNLKGLYRIIAQMAEIGEIDQEDTRDIGELERNFLSNFSESDLERARQLLDLGRASYRLRDDDNLLLGRIEGEVSRSIDAGRARVSAHRAGEEDLTMMDVVTLLRDPKARLEGKVTIGEYERPLSSRQLVGQPAIKGIATGKARVITEERQLFDFQKGEVLVCDSLDPNMTFVAPLCAAIVERRGGMLIHGAIIAREYGIPCVTGIPNATEVINTGDTVTVDGFLGIVTLGRGHVLKGPAPIM
jgi:phosphohistidine swiveling domain-containing protein